MFEQKMFETNKVKNLHFHFYEKILQSRHPKSRAAK